MLYPVLILGFKTISLTVFLTRPQTGWYLDLLTLPGQTSFYSSTPYLRCVETIPRVL